MDLSTLSDDQLRSLYQQPQQANPLASMSDAQLIAAHQAVSNQIGSGQPQQSSVNPVVDFVRSMPRGVASGFTDALANIGQSGALDAQFSGVPTADPASMPTGQQGMASIEQATGPMYKPQGLAGRVGAAVGEGLGNPTSYIGPGGLPLKIAGSILSSAGGELGGEAAKDTPFEGAARLIGGAAGGMAAAKTLGTTAAKAATPTLEELKTSANQGYNVARNSGLELSPKGISDFAGTVKQELTNGPKYAFSGGQYGSAPKTLALLDDLAAPPSGATVTSANLDTLRRAVGNIAGETKDFKPTPDAKAAMVLKQRLADYMENPPQDHIVAGSPSDYVGAIKQANGDYAAAARLGKVTQKLTNAENNAQGGIATSIENQQKGQLRNAFLNNPKALRGFSDEERSQLQRVNDGSFASNVFRQLGRGGTGVIPMAMQATTAIPAAMATGGASIVPQAALAAALYGSKKLSESMTNKQVNKLMDLLAQRSPLYQSRLNGLPASDTITNKAAMLRGLLGPALR